jgi:lysylphosphatidylglycerol synthetase-like protein (DUF2156 family)
MSSIQPDRDALKNFSDVNANLCRFYHEAEIRVGSLVNVANLAGLTISGSNIVLGTSLGPIKTATAFGVIIVVLGLIGILSILSYWRYYEACWLHVVECQRRMLTNDIWHELHRDVERQFRKEFPILRWVYLNGQHYIWLFSMALWIFVGLVIVFQGGRT